MEKLLSIFGLTTLRNANVMANKQSHIAVEEALREKTYSRVLWFARTCRKYGFKVVAVNLTELEAKENAKRMAYGEFCVQEAHDAEDFSRLVIPSIKASTDSDLLN